MKSKLSSRPKGVDHHADHIRGIHRITKSPHKKHSKKFFVLLSLGVVLFLAALVAFLVTNKTAEQPAGEVQQQNKQDAIEVLSSDSASISQKQRIESTLGFSVEIDRALHESTAQVADASSTDDFVSGLDYGEDELAVQRPYSTVTIRLDNDSQSSSDSAYATIATNIRQDFWDSRVDEGESRIDSLVRYNDSFLPASDGWVKLSSENVTIDGNAFVKKIHENTRSYGELAVTNKRIVYVSVQNDRPYTINIYNVKDLSLIHI